MSEPSIDLLEAEELRKAIIGGEVDAFVVGREDGNRKVLLLANAYQRYRQLVEKMHQGAVTTSPQGGILYANQRFSELLGIPLARLYTAPLQSYVRAADRARLAAFLERGAPRSIDVVFTAHDGSRIPARLSMAAFDGYASVLITDLKAVEWTSFAAAALESMRGSLEKFGADLGSEPAAQQAIADISEQINALAQLIDRLPAVRPPD
ncbi:MAG TPA: PAS domain-containing protein [Burkholderiales bacterium]|nr:PAS domain-containing protein [Burkholderiales bacterium]